MSEVVLNEDERIKTRLSSQDNCLNKYGNAEVRKNFTNRVGPKALSEESKELIGTLAHLDDQKNVAKTFGVSQARVSQLKNGLSSSNDVGEFDGELAGKIKSNVKELKRSVSETAVGRLAKALECITDDKLESAKLGELSLVVNSLGKVARLDEEQTGPNNNFVFYAPRNKQEDAYEIVEVA